MWFFTSVALAADPTVGGIVRPEAVVDIARDFDEESWLELHTWARAWARGEFASGDAWFLEARLQHHFLHQEDDSNDATFDDEGWWDLAAGETGWDGKIAGPLRLRVGALTERWGRLDLLTVNDVLNPRDGRSGLIIPTDWQRIPIPMAVVSVAGGPVRSETVLIPFSTADRLWLRETDWSYVRQGQTRDLLQCMNGGPGCGDAWGNSDAVEYTELLKNTTLTVDSMSPSFRRGLDSTVNGNNLPEAYAFNGEIGQRFELQAKNLDLAVMAGYLRSRQPEANLDPDLVTILETRFLPYISAPGEDDPPGPHELVLTDVQAAVTGGPLDVQWPRTVVAGADFSVLAGPLQIRGETMYQTAKVVRLPYARATTRPSVGAGLGLDYVRGSNFQATLEGRWLRVFDPPELMLFSLEDQITLAGGLRWSVANERLTLQLGGAYDLSYAEYLARPSVGYRFNDAVLAEVGALLLGGSTPPPESLEDSFVYPGGPASYFSQNDAITVAISFIK